MPRPTYLTDNPPNGSDISECQADVVDSEFFFLFVLLKIEQNGWNVETGIVAAVLELIDNGEEGLNFLLSDGESLWGFRKPQLTSHTLYYIHDTVNGYSAFASEYPSGSQGDWQIVLEDYLVVLTGDSSPVVIDVHNYTGGDLAIDAAFDNGSIGTYTITDNTVDMTLANGNAREYRRPYAYWLNFNLSNALNKEVTFNISGIDGVEFFDEQTEENQIVYSCDGDNLGAHHPAQLFQC